MAVLYRNGNITVSDNEQGNVTHSSDDGKFTNKDHTSEITQKQDVFKSFKKKTINDYSYMNIPGRQKDLSDKLLDENFTVPWYLDLMSKSLEQIGFKFHKTETLREERSGIDFYEKDRNGKLVNIDLKNVKISSPREYDNPNIILPIIKCKFDNDPSFVGIAKPKDQNFNALDILTQEYHFMYMDVQEPFNKTKKVSSTLKEEKYLYNDIPIKRQKIITARISDLQDILFNQIASQNDLLIKAGRLSSLLNRYQSNQIDTYDLFDEEKGGFENLKTIGSIVDNPNKIQFQITMPIGNTGVKAALNIKTLGNEGYIVNVIIPKVALDKLNKYSMTIERIYKK